jgi:ribokinase
MPKVLVIGSANVDFTVKVKRLPTTGETVSGGEFYTAFGGKGANQAVAALRAGAEVKFLAKVGCDENGEAILNHLKGLGMPTRGILREERHHTGVALIMVDGHGRNAIAVAPGSNWHLTEEDVRRAEPCIAWARVLLIQLEVPLPAVKEALYLAKRHELVTILNPAPARPLTREVLSLVDILTPNQVETGTISGITGNDQEGVGKAVRKIMASGAGQVLVTLGGRGACWIRHDAMETFPSFPVRSVDSTGAGDAFNGALACAVAEGMPLGKAIPFANAAGALSVMKRGAQSSLPTRKEIDRLLARAKDK